VVDGGYAGVQVLVAWCCYVDSRRHKATCYSHALDVYRRRLLTEGATQWLMVSSDLSQLRMKYATQKGVQVRYTGCHVMNIYHTVANLSFYKFR